MKILSKLAAAGALTLGLATGAQAVTFTEITPNQAFSFEFSWSGTPYTETHDLAVAYDFNLSLLNYSGKGTEQTGYYVDFNGTRLTTDTDACDSAGGTFVGGCNLITASAISGTTLLSGLSAGTYNFGIYDSATPESGALSFRVDKANPVAAVPLPAGGVLLLSALGALGLRKRRKAA